MSTSKSISIVIPVRNEAEIHPGAATATAGLSSRGHELIVVDGGSTDGTLENDYGPGDSYETGESGRSRQMNRGAARASGRCAAIPPRRYRAAGGRC